jgi:Rrf2 family protein
MKFSTQEEYGIRCLLTIADLEEGQSITIPEISQKEGLSSSHVAKLMSILRKGGYVESTRGQMGGYRLAKSPDQVSLKDLLEDLGGRLYHDEFCGRHSGMESECVHTSECRVKPLWSIIQASVDTVVGRLTLADLLNSDVPAPVVPIKVG